MWFKNMKVFRFNAIEPFNIESLETMRFVEQPMSSASIGWIEPRQGANLWHGIGTQILLTMRSQKKLLPAKVINQKTIERCKEVEAQQGYKPGRKQTKEIKERVTDELLPNAFSVYRDTNVWIDLVGGWLAIDSSTNSICDDVIGLLVKSLHVDAIMPLYVKSSPAQAMTEWLARDEAPDNFSIDQDTELRSSGESGAAIRYVKHSIDSEDAIKHIQQGKQVTKLALTWEDRISFVFTENFDIKRIKPLDVLKESENPLDHGNEEKFDSEFILMAGEMNKLLNDLVYGLGGEVKS